MCLKIHSATVAAVGADGHPQTRVIDMMLWKCSACIAAGVRRFVRSRQSAGYHKKLKFSGKDEKQI